jgi:7-cyano-7-deazaguanine synthase in queuosine biosynthesis
MTRLFCTPSPARAKKSKKSGEVPVLLYGVGTSRLAGIGHPIVEACRELMRPPSQRAWDFLSFALSVIAADSFVKRTDAADGWTREIGLKVELLNPSPWQEIRGQLEQTLRFLTGDIWHIEFETRGAPIPSLKTLRRKDVSCDCVCLFSGGLDSFIGALDLIAEGRIPYLVSCAYPKDAEKQNLLAGQLGIKKDRHFSANPDPRWDHDNETSMRARSFLFLALGTLIASTIRSEETKIVEVYIPENGFISLNVPLTDRRIGTLTTRTTHPHFIARIEQMLAAIELNIRIVNPYQFKTKGEMIGECKEPALLKKLSADTVSCGKWKRTSQQCGRCLPCLIRRAAFNSAKVNDTTDYRFKSLSKADDPEDIFAVRLASLKMRGDPEKWIRRSGPLPVDASMRRKFASVFERGLTEVDSYVAKDFA